MALDDDADVVVADDDNDEYNALLHFQRVNYFISKFLT